MDRILTTSQVPLSGLSRQLESTLFQSPPRSIKKPNCSCVSSEEETDEDARNYSSQQSSISDAPSTEPPLSVNDDVPSQHILGSEIDMLPYEDMTARSGKTYGLSPSNLGVSPLTASSLHVMKREYDRDTWRMYNRIHAARSASYQQPSNLKERSLSHPKEPSSNLTLPSVESAMEHDAVCDDSDAIFDLEMDFES